MIFCYLVGFYIFLLLLCFNYSVTVVTMGCYFVVVIFNSNGCSIVHTIYAVANF